MESTRKSSIRKPEDDAERGFTVTQVVGRVEFDDNADLTAHQQAFLMLANLDQPGTFEWTNRGHKVEVTVGYPDTDARP